MEPCNSATMAVAEESRITRAAERLGIQQPHIYVCAALETSKLSSNIW